MADEQQRIIILTGAYDDQHLRTRKDNPGVCTSAGKRLMLYRAITQAAGTRPLLLSPQPRGTGKAISLPAVASRFGEFEQSFSRASGIRKVRYVVDMIRYAAHVHRHTRSGDILIFDNYELIYVLAIYWCRICGRHNQVLLEYEDGKHAIDRGFSKFISSLAEKIGRRLVEGAILATPSLGKRLPVMIPKVTVPGILQLNVTFNPPPPPGQPFRFLYSGSLDVERGVPLLLDYLESPLLCDNTIYHITGQGNFQERLRRLEKKHPGRVHFHGTVSQEELARIRSRCHFGLNLQSSSNPISDVTYPSKTFDYMNASLRVVSTRAACVEEILADNAIYLESETVNGMVEAIKKATRQIFSPSERHEVSSMEEFSFNGTVDRLNKLLRFIRDNRELV